MHFRLWPHSLYFELHKYIKVIVKTIGQCHPGWAEQWQQLSSTCMGEQTAASY